MGDDNNSASALSAMILDRSLLDASTSEATEAQSRKGTKSAVKTTQTGNTSAESSISHVIVKSQKSFHT